MTKVPAKLWITKSRRLQTKAEFAAAKSIALSLEFSVTFDCTLWPLHHAMQGSEAGLCSANPAFRTVTFNVNSPP